MPLSATIIVTTMVTLIAIVQLIRLALDMTYPNMTLTIKKEREEEEDE